MADDKPMTLAELHSALGRLIERDPRDADLPVTFGLDAEPVCGGVIQRGRQTYVNLAPIKLDKQGGF